MGKIECTVDFKISNLFFCIFYGSGSSSGSGYCNLFCIFFVRLAIVCFLFEFRLHLKNKTGERPGLVLLFKTNMKWNHAEIEDTQPPVHTLRTRDTSTNTHTGAEMFCAEVASHAEYQG